MCSDSMLVIEKYNIEQTTKYYSLLLWNIFVQL